MNVKTADSYVLMKGTKKGGGYQATQIGDFYISVNYGRLIIYKINKGGKVFLFNEKIKYNIFGNYKFKFLLKDGNLKFIFNKKAKSIKA